MLISHFLYSLFQLLHTALLADSKWNCNLIVDNYSIELSFQKKKKNIEKRRKINTFFDRFLLEFNFLLDWIGERLYIMIKRNTLVEKCFSSIFDSSYKRIDFSEDKFFMR